MNAQNKRRQKKYIPALSYGWLTPSFGLFVRLTRENAFKMRMLERLSLEDSGKILDIGCGTGKLAVMARQANPGAQVIGLDGDQTIISEALRNAGKHAASVSFVRGLSSALPCVDNSFDLVLSSLVFHHLDREGKVRTLREARRVLRPGGELRIADLGKPGNPVMYAISMVMRHLEEAGENIEGRLPVMMEDAGFIDVTESDRFMTVFGSLSIYRATNPEIRAKANSHGAAASRRMHSEAAHVNTGRVEEL